MRAKKSRQHNLLVPAGILILVVGVLAGLNVLVSALPSPGFIIGVVDDWSHHHVAFRNASSAAEALGQGRFEEWYRTVNEPRYIMQQMRRNTMSRAMTTATDFASRMALLNAPTESLNEVSKWKEFPLPAVKLDWNVNVGPHRRGIGKLSRQVQLQRSCQRQ